MKGKKTGGRRLGVKNIVGKDQRAFVAALVNHYQDDFAERITNLSDRDFCKFFLDLLRFVIPQLQAVTLDETPKQDATLVAYVREVLGVGPIEPE